MTEFWIYVEIGLKHVLNLNGYDHLLFLMALTVSNSFNEWKRMLLFITVFTFGHSSALVLSVFDVIRINEGMVEFLIPMTILVTALNNYVMLRKSFKKETIKSTTLITLFFGVIHGLGFSNYFKTILPGNTSDKIVPLLEFSIGIEGAQMAVVLTVLTLSYGVQSIFKVSKRDFSMVVSAFIIGVVLPIIIKNEIWKTFAWI